MTAKKTKTAKKPAAKNGNGKMTGHKGLHRAGTIKSQLHELFDRFKGDTEKATAAALKLKPTPAMGTIHTSFSQFKNGK